MTRMGGVSSPKPPRLAKSCIDCSRDGIGQLALEKTRFSVVQLVFDCSHPRLRGAAARDGHFVWALSRASVPVCVFARTYLCSREKESDACVYV